MIAAIVDFETSLSTAQQLAFTIGSLNRSGAHGGAEELSRMTRMAGRFDLFDAWTDSPVAVVRRLRAARRSSTT